MLGVDRQPLREALGSPGNSDWASERVSAQAIAHSDRQNFGAKRPQQRPDELTARRPFTTNLAHCRSPAPRTTNPPIHGRFYCCHRATARLLARSPAGHPLSRTFTPQNTPFPWASARHAWAWAGSPRTPRYVSCCAHSRAVFLVCIHLNPSSY